MNRLLALFALLEAVTGLALMIAPSVVARLLMGADVSGAGAEVGRVAGIALVSLGLACWPGRDPVKRSGPAVRAMLTYNVLITSCLVFLGIGSQLTGVLLWPAVTVHGLLILFFVQKWPRTEQTQNMKG
jgi:hypothetical protein